MTHEDFRRVASAANGSHSKPPKNLTTRLNNLFHKHKSSNVSLSSDRATADSVNDVESVAASTVAGNTLASTDETIIMSNKTAVIMKPFYEQTKGRNSSNNTTDSKKNPWRKLKKMIHAKRDDLEDPPFPSGRSRSLSHPSVRSDFDDAYPMRKRVESDQQVRKTKSSKQQTPNMAQELDDAIRGRFDGMDILSLGSARRVSIQRSPDLLTRNAPMLTAQDMVADMLRMSAGRHPPELILEGFIANDRWLVRIESMASPDGVPQLQSTDDESSMDGSPKLSGPKLLASIWGRDRTPPPSHAQPEDVDQDDVFQLAASCSVPIDIDEETFIIDTPAHCQAVHDIAAVPLKVMLYCRIAVKESLRDTLHSHLLVHTFSFIRRDGLTMPLPFSKRFSKDWK